MSDYSQPEFYRFNQDSLELVKWVSQKIETADRLLDLGAGSGVIGIELANLLGPKQLALLEVQMAFHSHLEANLKSQLRPGIAAEVVLSSFGNWEPTELYDVIVSNPPYYLPGKGQPSNDERRSICRSFIKDDWQVFLGLISRILTPQGQAFLVIKNDHRLLALIEKLAEQLVIHKEVAGDLAFLRLARLHEDGNH